MLERFFTPYAPSTAVHGDRIAILAPHPDDEVFGCGGAAIKWREQGKQVQAFVVTDGVVEGEFGDQPNPEQMRQAKTDLRAAESTRAASILNMPAPEFLHRQDGALLNDTELASLLLAKLQAWQPTTLVIPSIWEMHRDHRAIAELGLSLAQQLPTIEQVALYEIGVPLLPNCLENITEQFEQKWQAMQSFPSQLAAQHYDEQIKGLNRYRSYTLGLDVRYAEAYCCLPVAQLETFIEHYASQSMTQTLMRAEQSIAQLNQDLQQLRTENQALRNSTSWRITKPLRWLKSKLS